MLGPFNGLPWVSFVEQSHKCYKVGDCLCLSSFINIEFKVSLVVSGQRPRRARCLLPQRKWATEAAWRSSGEARRVLKRDGWASEPAGKASDGAGRASDRAGWASQLAGGPWS